MLPSSYFGIPGSWNVLLNLLFSLLCVCVCVFFSSYHWKALIYFYFDHFFNFRACGQSKRTRGFKDITLFYLLNINQGSKASALKWGKSGKKITSSCKYLLSLFTVFFTTMRRTFTGRSHPVKQTWRPWKRNKRPFSSVDSKTRIRWNSGSSARFQIFTSEELKPYHHGISVLLV